MFLFVRCLLFLGGGGPAEMRKSCDIAPKVGAQVKFLLVDFLQKHPILIWAYRFQNLIKFKEAKTSLTSPISEV